MTSQTVGISWINNAAEASSYSWLENLATFNTGGFCPQTHGNVKQLAVTAYLNNVSPWNYMQRIQLRDDGSVSTRYGENCYDDSVYGVATNGQAMWYLPAFWYYTNHTPGDDHTYRWYTSPTGAVTDTVGGNPVTWKLHPAFIRNGVTKPWIALGAYEGYNNSGKLESKAGVTPTVSQTLATFRGYAQARGVGWQQQDYLSTCAVQMLYLIEYGGFNGKLLLGGGYQNTTLQNTGATAANGNASVGTSNSYTTPLSYRGLENPYGNVSKWIDGINIKGNYMPWIADNGFAVDTFEAPYVDSGLTAFATNGYWVTDITVSATYDYGFIPSAGQASGGGAIKLASEYAVGAGNKVVGCGGAYNGGASGAGDWCYWAFNAASSGTGSNVGARLMYIPQ